jgi:hypothetical protein
LSISGDASKALINKYTRGNKTPAAMSPAISNRYHGGDLLFDFVPIIALILL